MNQYKGTEKIEKPVPLEWDLAQIFQELNTAFFSGILEPPRLYWNQRLKSSAGRFIPPRKAPPSIWGIGVRFPAVIEIASYLRNLEDGDFHIKDTLAHEMIHYWLWSRKKPYGHTAEFKAKMREMGVSRYNTVPREQKYRYIYACPSCEKEFFARKKWKPSACLHCCRKYNYGVFHVDFKLFVKKKLYAD